MSKNATLSDWRIGQSLAAYSPESAYSYKYMPRRLRFTRSVPIDAGRRPACKRCVPSLSRGVCRVYMSRALTAICSAPSLV